MPKRKLYSGIALVVVLLAGFVTTSLVSYFVARDSLNDRIAEETLPLTSDNIFSEIQRDLLRSVLISSLMAHDTFVRDWTLDGEANTDRIVRYLDQIQTKYATSTAFFVSERTRRYYHSTGVLKTVRAHDPGDAWYFRVRGMSKPYEINVDHDTADRTRLSIFVNHRVTDYDGDYLGAIGIGLAVENVVELIRNYERRYGRRIYFVNREGDVMLHGKRFTGPAELQERPGIEAYATRILANPSTSVSYRRPDGATAFVNSRVVPELGWYLIVEQSESEGETRIQQTLVLNLLIALGITVVVLLLAHFTVRGYQNRLERMATTDGLTGAANRPAFEMLYEQTARTAQRRGEPVSLIALDIDRFKQLNDTYGHEFGDRVIRELSAIVRSHIRAGDSFCRWGGDEFLLLLGGCGITDARGVAEKLLEAARNYPVHHGREAVPISISLGVAEQRPGEHLGSLVQRADAALYASKGEGRGRVTAG